MTSSNNNYCVILAGGRGRRLWPSSRSSFPKQFMDFFGLGRTQLQQTYDRLLKVVPADHILVVTNEEYVQKVTEQLPEVTADRIIAEPVARNTAPSISWANHRISQMNPQANIMAVPSDQMIYNEEAFVRNVKAGFDFVSGKDRILTLGVMPTRPEPGYGYIQAGNMVEDASATEGSFCKVQSFTEKPDREFAKMFIESGEFYWNTGLFLANSDYLRRCFIQFLPPVLRTFDNEHGAFDYREENAYMKDNFPSYPNLSMDSGVLEKSEKVYLLKCDFGWADLGTWHSIYEAMQKSEDDNVVIDSDVMMENCHHNVIKLPKGKVAVINGLDGYIVAEHDNVLLICPKQDSSALVRKYVNEMQMKKGEQYI